MSFLQSLAASLLLSLTPWHGTSTQSPFQAFNDIPSGVPAIAPDLQQSPDPWLPIANDDFPETVPGTTDPHVRVDDSFTEFQVNSDYTFTRTSTSRMSVLTPEGIDELQRYAFSFYPESQSLELVEAYVIQPDGQKLAVTPDNIFTRPSPESQSAPGFTNSMTTTVVFPQLRVGSQIFVSWKSVQKTPEVIGFQRLFCPAFDSPTTRQRIRVVLPVDLDMRWRSQGPYQVTDETQGDRRIIIATLENQPAYLPEDGMVSLLDVSPLFLFSGLENWEALGATYWRQSSDRLQVTPEIQQLADEITAGKQGIEAARVIYNWVTQRINYVAVYLDLAAGYVPHPAADVLKNGYGDCKDHVVLMQALLKAKGIESYPVLISWGRSYRTLPLPVTPFNHAIIYLPAYNIFANPTDRHAAFGELDTGLRGKFVVIGDAQGRTATTPTGVAQNNCYALTNTLTIAPDGSIQGQSNLQFSGDFNNWVRPYFASDTPEKIANDLLAYTPEGGNGTLQWSDLDQLDQSVTAQGQWSSPYGISMGQQVYLTTPTGIDLYHLSRLRGYITPGDRQYSIVVGAKDLSWTYNINLPAGYRVQRLPEAIEFANAAGRYTSRYITQDNQITVQRELVINQDVYSPEEYAAFRELLYKPVNDVRSVMVLNKE
ncbi:MAG: DUF3857 domain-containing protein [Oculatellaceae cyanobacterium Prado106]|jgi:hypothetical protein|nr:DUF3857 domain-containing protein [Oculatellaceae cyanobacterium Prado106]